MPIKKYLFRRTKPRLYPAYALVLLFLLVCSLMVWQAQTRGTVKPLFLPTPTSTRMANSFVLEARTHFDAGNLDAAVKSFQQALTLEPQNGELYAELARVLTYSSQMVTTDVEREARLKQALDYAKKGTDFSPDSSTVHAIYAFSLDWYATYISDTLLDKKLSEQYLLQADQEIGKATFLDETNLPAQIYYAEIMVDFARWDQAKASLQRVLARDPNQWEAHRINGLYLENQAEYELALNEYITASNLAPNMTFLYITIGKSYRLWGMRLRLEKDQMAKFEIALQYFDKAATLNEQLGINDPTPYLGIGYTYAQEGEFYIASRNMSKALSLNPYSAKVYGDLGMVARQGKNYELAVSALKCAVEGCDADTSCQVRQCNTETDAPITIKGLTLTPNTVSYYFTYAALLSGLWVTNDPTKANYCDTALKIIAQVRAVPEFNNEPVYDSIMKESESICR